MASLENKQIHTLENNQTIIIDSNIIDSNNSIAFDKSPDKKVKRRSIRIENVDSDLLAEVPIITISREIDKLKQINNRDFRHQAELDKVHELIDHVPLSDSPDSNNDHLSLPPKVYDSELEGLSSQLQKAFSNIESFNCHEQSS